MELTDHLATSVTAEARQRLAHSFTKIRHCLDQLTDAQVWWRPQESHNSIGNIILHLCGNVRQWLVAGLRGGPDARDRPAEFSERDPIPKGELLRRLEEVVRDADAAMSGLSAPELLRPRRIQGFDVTALGAIFDSVPHFAGHMHQIVYITRLQLGDAYRFEWAPATAEQGAPQ